MYQMFKNKGATLKLDPDKVEMNGKGIFSIFKRAVKGTAKNVSKNLAKTMKNKKVQNFATAYAVDVGASVLSSNPLVAPLVNRATDREVKVKVYLVNYINRVNKFKTLVKHQLLLIH